MNCGAAQCIEIERSKSSGALGLRRLPKPNLLVVLRDALLRLGENGSAPSELSKAGKGLMADSRGRAVSVHASAAASAWREVRISQSRASGPKKVL